MKEALATGEVLTAAPGDESLDAPGENDHLDAFYEVYVPGTDDTGESFLLETYINPRQIAASDAEVFSALLPVGIGGLLLLQLALIPLAYVLARNIERGRRHRAELLERFFDFWQQERLHLAHELHDGVVQDLSGAAYVMPSIVNRLPPDAEGDEAKAAGMRIGNLLRQNLRAIRSWSSTSFRWSWAATSGTPWRLSGHAERDAGTEVEIDLSEDLVLDPTVATLIYRVVRSYATSRSTPRPSGSSSRWSSVEGWSRPPCSTTARASSSTTPRGRVTSGSHCSRLSCETSAGPSS